MADTPAIEIALDWQPSGRNGTGTMSVRRGAELLHSDKLDPVRASARKRFIDDLLSKFPALPRTDLERELLGVADQLTKTSDPTATEHAPELDITKIVRAELFHTADVSGLAVPHVRLSSGKPVGSWALYCRWADGRRERRELESSIELPDGGRLWLHPIPGEPEPTLQPAWSTRARSAWLAGADAPNPADVWARIVERFAHFLDFPPDAASGTIATLTTWVFLTYAYPAWATLPYLAVGGPMASGKTTLFRVLAQLVFRPLETSNMTAPCLFRTLHDRGGVLLLDEAERLRDGSPESGELRSVLLSGYKRGSPAIRLEKANNGGFTRTEFNVFGPKALAAIASLPEALASRCIRVGMFRAAADSPKPRRRLDENPDVWAAIRDDLHAIALEYGQDLLRFAKQTDVVPATLGGREFELWQPLLALAAWLESCGAAGLLGLLQEHAEQTVELGRDDAVPESDELLLKFLANHVIDGTHRTLKAGDLLKQAREADAVSFGKWTPKGVGNALARYGLRTRRGRGNAGRTYSAVTLGDLRQVVRAYGFDLGLPDEHVSTCIPCIDKT